jgi:hypothetical protein
MSQVLYFNSEAEARRYLSKLDDEERHHNENMRRAGVHVPYKGGGYELKPVHGDPYKWELRII